MTRTTLDKENELCYSCKYELYNSDKS